MAVLQIGFKAGLHERPEALHQAGIHGQADAVEWLLAHGASPDNTRPSQSYKDFCLLYLAAGASWVKSEPCWRLGNNEVESLAQEWHVPTGPRYHIFLALLQAGAKPPPREEWYYLIMATHSCRIVSAPTFQLMLQYGANINHLCTCPDHEGLEGEIWPMSYYWFWDNGKAHHKCAHQGDFMPWSQSVRQRVSEEMCGFLVEHDEKFGPLFSTEVDGSKQSDE
jgi:hypothetical protein